MRELLTASKTLTLLFLTSLVGCSASEKPSPPVHRSPPESAAEKLTGHEDRGPKAPSPVASSETVHTRFLVFGDTGTGRQIQFQVGRSMGHFCQIQKCAFAFHTGDIIFPRGLSSPQDPALLERLERPYTDLKIPLYLTLGNHDHFGSAEAMIAAWRPGSAARTRALLDARLPSNYYTFTQGGVRFVVLDTDAPDKTQERWAIDVLDKSRRAKEPWIIAVGHHPRRSTGLHGDAIAPQRPFLDRVLCHRVDLYLSGHDHDLELMEPFCGYRQIISGAADAVRIMRGGQGSIFSSTHNGWAMIDIQGAKLVLSFYDVHAKRLFSRRLQRLRDR